MAPSTVLFHAAAGWFIWSLSHNLGHRWWHVDMRKGKQTFYAHGERMHHRYYDSEDLTLAHAEDPTELFISFPAKWVALMVLVPVLLYGAWLGVLAALCFGAGLYGSLSLDHLLHKRFHRGERLPGVLGWFQHMHVVHHATHTTNFFFVSGLVWDLLFGTLKQDAPEPTPPASFGS